MRPAELLNAIAHGKPTHDNRAFGGYCIACDRPLYKQRFFKDERTPGWVVRANSYRCYQCYRKRKASDEENRAG
ncbi:UNVERIFIED_ORG: hypothetical protein M2328_006078 [Rhodococcus erythropolis]